MVVVVKSTCNQSLHPTRLAARRRALRHSGSRLVARAAELNPLGRRMKPILLGFVLLVLVTPAVSADFQAARKLNTKGMAAYRSKQYEDAIDYFHKAVEADPNYALAHFNLACTLTLLERDGERSTFGEALDHLEKVVAIDPKYRKKINNDPDLQMLRSTVRYQILMGRSLSDEGFVREILINGDWGICGENYSQISRMQFKFDGTFNSSHLSEGAPKWEERKGTYALKGNHISLKFSDGDKKTAQGIFQENALEIPGEGYFYDRPKCN